MNATANHLAVMPSQWSANDIRAQHARINRGFNWSVRSLIEFQRGEVWRPNKLTPATLAVCEINLSRKD